MAKILCPHCQGQCEVEERLDCIVCDATGRVVYEFKDGTTSEWPCANCAGRGWYSIMVSCPECRGTGEVDDD